MCEGDGLLGEVRCSCERSSVCVGIARGKREEEVEGSDVRLVLRGVAGNRGVRAGRGGLV